MPGKIGVAITTVGRPAVLAKSLAAWAQFLRNTDILVLIHDHNREGVATSKNRSIAALVDADVEHLFLADDDLFPISTKWWSLYSDSGANHLCYCWGKSRFEGRLNRDGTDYTLWSWPRGCLLYVRRKVIERVGGMRTDFGVAGGEHVEFSRRIHNVGFTPHPFMDLTARGIWHYQSSAPTTLGRARYNDPQISGLRHNLLAKHQLSTEFVPYRQA